MSLLPPSHALAPSRHSLSRVHRRAAEAGSGPSGGGGTIHTTDEAGGETGRTRPVMSDARNRADRVDGADGADGADQDGPGTSHCALQTRSMVRPMARA